MKKLVFVVLLAVTALCHGEEEAESSVSEKTKSVVSGLVKFSKDLIDGADEGVDEGRKTGQSKDGAVIVDNTADLEKLLEIKFLGVKGEEDGGSSVEIGFKNVNEHPVRIINLNESENVLVIDNDGYASNLSRGKSNPEDLTVPSKAGKKQAFYFDIPADSIKEIRIMGLVFSN